MRWLQDRGRVAAAAVDAPLIVPNETGQRVPEGPIGPAFGAFGASAHTSNRANHYLAATGPVVLAKGRHRWASLGKPKSLVRSFVDHMHIAFGPAFSTSRSKRHAAGLSAPTGRGQAGGIHLAAVKDRVVMRTNARFWRRPRAGRTGSGGAGQLVLDGPTDPGRD